MANFVFYDFETSSSNKYWGQIIQIGAVLTNDKLETKKQIHMKVIFLLKVIELIEEKIIGAILI